MAASLCSQPCPASPDTKPCQIPLAWGAPILGPMPPTGVREGHKWDHGIFLPAEGAGEVHGGCSNPTGPGSPGGHSTLPGELAWSEPRAAPKEGGRVSPTALWSLAQCVTPAILRSLAQCFTPAISWSLAQECQPSNPLVLNTVCHPSNLWSLAQECQPSNPQLLGTECHPSNPLVLNTCHPSNPLVLGTVCHPSNLLVLGTECQPSNLWSLAQSVSPAIVTGAIHGTQMHPRVSPGLSSLCCITSPSPQCLQGWCCCLSVGRSGLHTSILGAVTGVEGSPSVGVLSCHGSGWMRGPGGSSLPVHAQSPGLKASPMATLGLPQGQRGFAHSHPPPPRQPLVPWGCHQQKRQGDAQPQTSSSLLGLSGQWGCTGLMGPTVPMWAWGQASLHCGSGQCPPNPSKRAAGREQFALGAPSRGLGFLLSVKAAVCTRGRPW
uniref:Uncharacterized protein n=1 Tax=Cyanoderma ruficeps TaxID=181631 RepID=A0A8C3QVX5_9PASS